MTSLNKIAFLIVLCFIVIYGCERSIDWEVEGESQVRLVVDALLTDELHFQELNLSTTYSQLNSQRPGIDDAEVSVIVNDLVYVFDATGDGSGRYVSREEFAIVGDLEYRLLIDWAGKQFQATSRLSNVAPMPAFNFLPYRGGDSLYLGNNVVPLFSPTQQSMYRIDVDWSHIHQPGLNRARMYYYTFNSVHNSQFIRPEAELVPFPKMSIVHVAKYGLSDDFAQFLRAQVIETDWNGPILYGNPENAQSNISGDGLGFFATCTVLRETLIAE